MSTRGIHIGTKVNQGVVEAKNSVFVAIRKAGVTPPRERLFATKLCMAGSQSNSYSNRDYLAV